jgi:hypothetical protein
MNSDPSIPFHADTTTALRTIELASWTVLGQENSRTTAKISIQDAHGLVGSVTLERCTSGRLRDAYPVSEHDLEARVSNVPPAAVTSLLSELVAAIQFADPRCRRVVFAAAEGDLVALSAAEDAGFRYVIDVDLPDGAVSLAVAEPAWVTAVDMDLDHVPGT